jgi:hypothetical protein
MSQCQATPLVIALSLLMFGQAFAADKPRPRGGDILFQKNVCWGDGYINACSNYTNPWPGEDWRRFTCWSGGASGFNPHVVCRAVCNTSPGPRCEIAPGHGGPYGECGFRWARVRCRT